LPGAKAYNHMQMTIFADIHKGSQMFCAKEDLSTHGTIEHFQNAASH
jgi:DNA polymerase II small subunit/DNA polymerase delta subunit B